ncbi:MAG: arsenite methyltransferase [Clostridia bacterium]|nr:arsenite methyltransferase [Clostridia bacterium]
MLDHDLKNLIRERYDEFVRRGGFKDFRSPDIGGAGVGIVGQRLYEPEEVCLVPRSAFYYSMGCTTPTRFIDMRPGEAVLDIGCGIGIDVILAAHKVGPKGKVIGVDLSPLMIERAREVIAEAGLQRFNVELLVADMEKLPLPSNLVDVVISNGAINQSLDKYAVYREAYRVLKPGGRMAIADIVLTEKLDPELQKIFRCNWSGCLGAGMEEKEYLRAVGEAGFEHVEVFARRLLSREELEVMVSCPVRELTPPLQREHFEAVQGKVASIKFRAIKPLQN